MSGRHPGVAPDDSLPVKGYEAFTIVKDMTMARVFNISRDYTCFAFNPTVPSPRDNGGRFDRTCLDDSPYLYAARSPKKFAAHTALVETLRPLWSGQPPNAPKTILIEEIENKAIQFFKLREPITLANLNTENGLDQLGGREEVCYHDDRRATQSWGHYWQSQLSTDVVGLAYNSVQETRGKGESVVLWGDRIDNANLFVPASAELGLTSKTFFEKTRQVLLHYRVNIVAHRTA